MKTLTTLQIFLAAMLLTVLYPHMKPESFVCLVILMAGAVVVLREVRALSAAGSAQMRARQPRSSPAVPLPGGDAPRTASGEPRIHVRDERRMERRVDGIELRPHDSVEQIARVMVTTSFRQASMKYHPDHGGSNDLMGRIVQARTILLSALGR